MGGFVTAVEAGTGGEAEAGGEATAAGGEATAAGGEAEAASKAAVVSRPSSAALSFPLSLNIFIKNVFMELQITPIR